MEKSLNTNNKNIVDLKTASATKAQFNWEDPLLLDSLISEEENLIKSTAYDYAQSKLMPRVEDAFLDEKTDKEILNVENDFSKSTFDLYKTFKIEPTKIVKLDNYFQDYFIKMLKRLKDINFEIEQGDAVGIIGRNGAGKSTLLKILSRVTTPTTGRINIKGRVASLLEVGTGFHPELTGRENIYLNGAILGMRKREIDRKLEEIIDFSGVERYIDTPVKRYSSGMYVRLAFAVAAHLESEILIVDEVLAVGDVEFQKKCLGKMGEVSKGEGRTVLFVSHNMAAVQSLCKKGILLENGLNKFNGNISQTIKIYNSEFSNKDSRVFWDSENGPGNDTANVISIEIKTKDAFS